MSDALRYGNPLIQQDAEKPVREKADRFRNTKNHRSR